MRGRYICNASLLCCRTLSISYGELEYAAFKAEFEMKTKICGMVLNKEKKSNIMKAGRIIALLEIIQ